MDTRIEEAFNLVRNSVELGAGSMSTYDEAMEDSELREDIETFFFFDSKSTAQDYFDFCIKMEKIREERDNEYREERINEEPNMWAEIAAEEAMEYQAAQNAKCGGCGAKGEYYDGLCYQCQAEYHSMGAYDMDGDGWR